MAEQVRRAILKVTGESFGEKRGVGIGFRRYDRVARQIVRIIDETDVQLAIVVGGGNIFRGRNADSGVDHTQADAMGMLATVINGIGLREALIRNGAPEARQMVAFDLPIAGEPYIQTKARHHLDRHRPIILSGGLGRPNFTTDSAVAQYADELQCELILKASTVNGVYDRDPKSNKTARRYSFLTYREALVNNLQVMDVTAFAMCQRSRIPIFVFSAQDLNRIPKALRGDFSFGTIVRHDKKR